MLTFFPEIRELLGAYAGSAHLKVLLANFHLMNASGRKG